MSRAIITLVIREIVDDHALAIKRQVEDLVRDLPDAEVQMNLLPR